MASLYNYRNRQRQQQQLATVYPDINNNITDDDNNNMDDDDDEQQQQQQQQHVEPSSLREEEISDSNNNNNNNNNNNDGSQQPLPVAKPVTEEEEVRARSLFHNIPQAVFVDEAAEAAERIERARLREEIERAKQLQQQEEERRLARRRRNLGCVVVFIIIVVVVILVVVLTKQNNNNNNNNPITDSPTLAPSILFNKNNNNSAPTINNNINKNNNAPTDLNTNNAQSSIYTILKEGSNHTLMTQYVHDTQLDTAYLDGSVRITVFAPTDTSWRHFANASASYARYVDITTNNNNNNSSSLFSNDYYYWKGHLEFLLKYHIITFAINTTSFFTLFGSATADGVNLQASANDGTVGDNGAVLVTSDIPAWNGYIHIPDRVLIYAPLSTTIKEWMATHAVGNNFQLFERQIDDSLSFASLLEQSFPAGMTLLAPIDTAMEKFNTTAATLTNTTNSNNNTTLQQFLEYHLLPINLYAITTTNSTSSSSNNNPILITAYSGHSIWISINNNQNNKATFNGDASSVQQSPYFVQNGIVSLIDQVLFPPNLRDLLHITNNVHRTNTNYYQTTTFLNVTVGAAQLGDILLLRNNIMVVGGGGGSSNSSHNSNIGTSLLTLLAPLDSILLNQTSSDDAGSSVQVFHRYYMESGWLLHLQNVIQHHVTTENIIPITTITNNTTAINEGQQQQQQQQQQRNILMQSGFNTSVIVQADGNIVTVDGILVEPIDNAPLRATNGVIYFLNGLLLPPWTSVSIVDMIRQDSDLTSLVTLIASANLTNLLEDDGPWTLFAPSNSALAAKLNTTTSSSSSSYLQNLLLGHILKGNWYSSTADAANNTILVALNSQRWQVETVGNQSQVGGVSISTTSNVLASNGVIHILDGVLGV